MNNLKKILKLITINKSKKMSKLETLKPKQFDEFLKKINLELSSVDLIDTSKITVLQDNIKLVHAILYDKDKNVDDITYIQKKFLYETTTKEIKMFLNFELFKDFIFKDIYHIYLTDSNQEINDVSKIHSKGIEIRNFLGIDIKPIKIKEILCKIINEFLNEILKNEKLNKENYQLKIAVKKEYKDFEDDIIKENLDISNKTFEIALFAKMIYLLFIDSDIKTEIVRFNKEDFTLDINFYVHIAFKHYYHFIKNTEKFSTKDHFFTNGFDEWKDIILRLSIEFNKMNYDFINTSVIIFILENTYYKLVVNKKNKKITTLFPLSDDAISTIDKNSLLIIL